MPDRLRRNRARAEPGRCASPGGRPPGTPGVWLARDFGHASGASVIRQRQRVPSARADLRPAVASGPASPVSPAFPSPLRDKAGLRRDRPAHILAMYRPDTSVRHIALWGSVVWSLPSTARRHGPAMSGQRSGVLELAVLGLL